MFEPISTEINPRGTVETISIALQGDGSNGASVAALQTLRNDVLPASLGRLSGVDTAVSGETAGTHDFNQQMKSHAPFVFAFVLALCFILLLVTFRSIVIPIKAVLLNLLSVGAAYGLLVLVFQHRFAEGILGFHSNGAITSWLPLFLFVILFGLSMDYHVFILSRVKELVDDGMPTEQAVAVGIKRTAGTVTSAAVVMVAVFAIFATLRSLDIKQMGFGLAAAILIDSTIVRAVLLPATMKLLGDWNWYLPSWLEWLPRLNVESQRGSRGRGRERPHDDALRPWITSSVSGEGVPDERGHGWSSKCRRRGGSSSSTTTRVSAALRRRCSTAEGFEVVGEAEDGASALARPRPSSRRSSSCSTFSFPTSTGSRSPRRLLESQPELRIVLVSSRDRRQYGPLIEASGARGFVSKGDLSGESLEGLLD